MTLSKEIEILVTGAFLENYFDLLSINEIAKRINKKYPFVHQKVIELVRKTNLRSIKVGRATMCSLNLDNSETVYSLGYHHIKKREEFYSKNPELKELVKSLIKEKPDFIIAAYEKKNPRLIIVTNKKKRFKNEIISIITQNELLEMMKKRHSQIFKTHNIVYGFESFSSFLKENKAELQMIHNPIVRSLQ